MQSVTIDHIWFNASPCQLECRRCGAAEPMRQPIGVDDFHGAITEFRRLHENCWPSSATDRRQLVEKVEARLREYCGERSWMKLSVNEMAEIAVAVMEKEFNARLTIGDEG